MSYTKKIGRHYGNLMQNLNIQRCIGEFCDLTVIIQKDHFNVHKCVLAAASKKLHGLIGNLKSTCNDQLSIDNLSPQGFKIVLEYIYTSSLWIPADCLADVSNAAMYLEMDDLIQSCLAFDFPQNRNLQAKTNSTNFDSNENDGIADHDRHFQSGSENIPTALIENKLPELDSSLGGFLDTDQQAPPSVSVSNYDDNKLAESTNDNDRGNFGTYPDQDALSEISVQNDGPTDDDIMYQLRSNDISEGPNGVSMDYPYMHYGPPDSALDQGYSPRRLPKMLPTNMALLPGILPTHSFLPDQNQFPVDGYFLPQVPPPQFYPGNVNMMNNYMQDHGRGGGDYDLNNEQDYNPMSTQNYQSSGGDKRPFTSYATESNGNPSPFPHQGQTNFNTPSYPHHSYGVTNKTNREFPENFSNEQQEAAKTGTMPDSHNFMQNQSISPVFQAKERIVPSTQGEENNQLTPNSNITNQDMHYEDYDSYPNIQIQDQNDSELTCKQRHENTHQNMDRDSDVTYTSPIAKINQSKGSESEDVSSQMGNVQQDLPLTSTSHFSTRPVARMPPKKAGYRGIESDYNREFNTGIKSDIVGQYDNLAAIVESHSFSTNKTNLMESSKENMPAQNRSNSHEKSTLPFEDKSTFPERTSVENRKNENPPPRRHSVHDFYLAHDSFPDTNSYSTKMPPANSAYENPAQNVVSNRPYPESMPFHDNHSSEFYDFPPHVSNNETTSNNTQNRSHSKHSHESHAPLLSPISTQSMDIVDYDSRDRDMPFDPNMAPSAYDDTSSHFNNFSKGISMTPSKGTNFSENMYSHIEDYLLRGIDPHHSQSPIKLPPKAHGSHTNFPPPTFPVTSSLYVNTDTPHSVASPIYTNISPTPIPSQVSTTNFIPSVPPPIPPPSQHTTTGFSVEEVRKNILNVLSQERFDDGVTSHSLQPVQNVEREIEKRDQDRNMDQDDDNNGVSLTQLYQLKPFDKYAANTRTTENEKPKNAETQIENGTMQSIQNPPGSTPQPSNTTPAILPPPQFSDIDSDSGSESNYKLVIDFDKEIHREETPVQSSSSDKTTQVYTPVKKAYEKRKSVGTKAMIVIKPKGGKGILSNYNQISDSDARRGGDKDSHNISTENEDIPNNEVNGAIAECDNENVNAHQKSNETETPIKIPKYSITTEYKESAEKGGNDDKIIKPLKKRIKLTLNMTKLQENDAELASMSIDVIRKAKAEIGKSQPNRRVKYTCELCGREFWERYRAFAEHMQAHSKGTLHFCRLCGVGYQRLEDLSRHRNTVHQLQSFTCIHCHKNYSNPVLYRKHCIGEHKETKMFRCLYDNCTFTCARLNVLERHTLIHGEERQFTCVQCGKSFSQPNGLRHHLLSCMNMQQFTCTTCNKTFNRVQSLREHEAIHTGAKKHVCTECSASFTDQRNLKRHARIHSKVLPYACTHCNLKFRYSNVLKRHLASKHQRVVEKGKKGSKNTDAVLVSNYSANSAVACS